VSGTIKPLLRLEGPEAGLVAIPGTRLVGYGYVLSAARVAEITVFLGGTRLCAGAAGLMRSDVTEQHPDEPSLKPEGFAFSGTVPADLPHGPAELVVIARTSAGEARAAVALSIGPQTTQAQALPVPIQDQDSPVANVTDTAMGAEAALILRVEEVQFTKAGLLLVRGWACALTPLERIEIHGPEGILGSARLGLVRRDVARDQIRYPDALRSGFRFEQLADFDVDQHKSLRVIAHAQGLPPRMVLAKIEQVETTHAEPDLELHQEAAKATPPPMLLRLEEAHVSSTGLLRVRGWVVGLGPIDQIRVFVEDRLLGVAEKGLSRADVGETHSDYPDSAHAGFLFQQMLDETFLSGQTLSVVARMAAGGITRQVSTILHLASPIRRAVSTDATIHFHCDEVRLTEDGDVEVLGWAVCASGIATITAQIEGETVGRAQLGRERPDVGNHYPTIPSARLAGFRLAGRTSVRVTGERVLRLLVCGQQGEEREILLPVLATPSLSQQQAGEDGGAGIRFYLDTPTLAAGETGQIATETVRGFLSLAGWALSPAGIAGIEVFLDGISLGEAFYGIRREDIGRAFPTMANALLCGFAMLVSPQVLRRGQHEIRLIVRDKAGASAESSFTVTAEPASNSAGPWMLREKLPRSEIDLHLAIIDAAGPRPFFALEMTLGGAAEQASVAATLASLRRQAYPHWSLHITSAMQNEAAARDMMAALLILEPSLSAHIKWDPIEADAQFRGRLRAGEKLGADALLECAVASAMHAGCDFLYADERRIDPADGEMKAFFKPDWSPDLQLSTNYIGCIWFAKAALYAACAPFDEAEGEYGKALRLTERAQRIVHIPLVLAERATKTLDTAAAERQALRMAAKRRGLRGTVETGCIPGVYRLRRRVPQNGAAVRGPGKGRIPGMVSIIIPTAATRGLIKICLESIRTHSSWRNFEFICLDNISDDNKEWKYFLSENSDKTIKIKEKFNWSRFNNKGAAVARGEFLLFLNDDIEVLPDHPDWLECLIEHAQRPEVGVVGPQLLYPDHKVQHAGMFLSGDVARHAFRFLGAEDPGPFGLARMQRNVTSVTGACYMVRRDVFDALGGFDEAHSVVNNDLDFCLRAQQSGLHVIYTPHTTLIHHEMVSRANIRDIYDVKRFSHAWQSVFLRGDRYFSPHLCTDHDGYVPEAEPTRVIHAGHPLIAAADVKRILVVKLDHIGDFITTMPALRRLKTLFPQAELHVLAARASLTLAALEPAIDEMHEFNFFFAKSAKGQRKLAQKELSALRARLAPYHFDLALDLRRQGDTREVLRSTGATWLAGFDQRYQHPWLDLSVDWEGDIARHSKRAHIGDALLQFVEAIGVMCRTDRHVMASQGSIAEARRRISTLPAIQAITPDLYANRLICVHPGAGNENKQWPNQHFAGLIDLLIEGQDASIVMIGGPDEVSVAESVLADVRRKERVHMLVGKTRLADLPHVLSACELYVGNDSGPKHMAAALGVPTIGIHSGTVDAMEWGPVGPAAVALRRDMSCSPCYLSRIADCHRNLACLRGLKPGDVYRACERMLALAGLAQAERAET